MTSSVPSARSGPQSTPLRVSVREREAHLLADLLRTWRLTLLYGATGSGKTELILAGLMPMLHRRATDTAVPRGLAPRVVIPFPDRRRGIGGFGPGRVAEVAVVFDAWDGAPLPRLQAAVHEALGIAAPAPSDAPISLAGLLDALNRQFGARFLLILDRFDEALLGATERPELRDFIDELVHVLNRPLLPVNTLIAMRDSAKPLLGRLRSRVPGFDDHFVHLADPAGAAPPGGSGDSVATAAAVAPTPLAPPAPPSAPILRRVAPMPPAEPAASSPTQSTPAPDGRAGPSTIERAAAPPATPPRPPPAAIGPSEAEWFASIGHIIARAADAARGETPVEPDGGGAALPIDAEPAGSAGAAPAAPIAASAPQAAALAETAPRPAAPAVGTAPRPAAWTWAGGLALGVLLTGASLAVLWWLGGDAEPDGAARLADNRPAAAPAALPRDATPAAPALPTPTLQAAAPATPRRLGPLDVPVRLLDELGRALGPAAAAPGTPLTWPAGFMPLPGHPRLAVARYDALQAARRDAPSAPLQIVSPLYTEELYFVTRADSPLTFLHDIGGAAINAGPPGSARAVTAAGAYARLFNAPLPRSTVTAEDGDAALGHLLTGLQPEVMVVVGAQPSDWLTSLPPATARALKLLRLDRANPTDQRLLAAYLPADLRPGRAVGNVAAASPSAAVMSFLVAADTGAADAAGPAAQALCDGLPALRSGGHPKWREVLPGLSLAAGWPVAASAAAVWRGCVMPAASTASTLPEIPKAQKGQKGQRVQTVRNPHKPQKAQTAQKDAKTKRADPTRH